MSCLTSPSQFAVLSPKSAVPSPQSFTQSTSDFGRRTYRLLLCRQRERVANGALGQYVDHLLAVLGRGAYVGDRAGGFGRETAGLFEHGVGQALAAQRLLG